MLIQVCLLGELVHTARDSALEGPLTGMNAKVVIEVVPLTEE